MTIEEIRIIIQRGHVAIIRGQIAILEADQYLKSALAPRIDAGQSSRVAARRCP